MTMFNALYHQNCIHIYYSTFLFVNLVTQSVAKINANKAVTTSTQWYVSKSILINVYVNNLKIKTLIPRYLIIQKSFLLQFS